ncbi:hypothetical protein JTB14_036457 [Gonioctena quinquepunctata]|nr:hypothetical protein JTB14_036457 [Gonioctena quinquepunctata]
MSDSQAAEPLQPKEVTKTSIRRNVWDQLYKNKIVVYPRPFGRIPNFIGADQASTNLLELDAFRAATSIEVNPDKVLESARALVLENNKDLYVPYPGLEQGLMKKLELVNEHNIKTIVSRWGIESTGKRIEIKDKVHIDLLILGSVAVSEDGHRIGKGQGYADLEFAIFKEMKAIDDNTVLVTIVDDSQVFHDLPTDIFMKYDVPVDYILTPTRSIKVEHCLPKPEGIYWNELNERQVKARKILQEMKQKHESEGRDTTLKVETPEEQQLRRPFYRRRFYRRRPRPRMVNDKTVNQDATSEEKPAVPRPRQKKSPRSASVKSVEAISNSANNGEQTDDIENMPPQKKHGKKKKKTHIDYSLRVSNIQRSVRVRDLKNALREKGIKPNNITWKGYRGFCFLHYAKKNQKKEIVGEESETKEESDAINNVIELIQELKINPNSERNLSVKVMEPITRIETVNVTAV